MRLLLIFLLVPFLSRSQGTSFDLTSPTLPCRDSIEKLVNQAMNIIRRDYYRKEEVDWLQLNSSISEKIRTMESCEEVQSIISWCFTQLEEKHSFIMPAAKAKQYSASPAKEVSPISPSQPVLSKLGGKIEAVLEEDNTAFIAVPWISTTDAETCTKLADSLQSIIERFDKAGASKWIIDLRSNTGGNCWPMIAGMGPLLGDGVCGYFVFPEYRKPWIYRNGAAMHDNNIITKTSKPGYQLTTPVKKIAVLIGGKTSSSGEILALAFKGRSNVELIGSPTAGFTTANTTYTLKDNSLLVLSVCKEADRTGKVCEGKINPDQTVSTAPAFQGDDPVKMSALMWLAIY